MHYTTEGGDVSVNSNESDLLVAEILDVALTRVGEGALAPDNGSITLPLTLRNAGNGGEAFVVTASTDVAGGRIATIAVDVDGDGRFDPAKDTVLVDGRTPSLAPGATIRLVVVTDGAPAAPSGSISVTAAAATGAGTPGTDYPGRGDGGSDAIVGTTGASASVSAPVGGASGAPQLVKSADVRAPDGTPRAVHGATITYTLAARFAGPLSGVSITDPIPAGTLYRAGSLTLDGVALSDAADGDAGRVDAGGIAVALGTIPAAGTRTVRFQVTIQ